MQIFSPQTPAIRKLPPDGDVTYGRCYLRAGHINAYFMSQMSYNNQKLVCHPGNRYFVDDRFTHSPEHAERFQSLSHRDFAVSGFLTQTAKEAVCVP